MTNMSNDMRTRGVVVLITHGRAEDVEDYVRALARRSGQECDWGYVGGRAVVSTLGDPAAVRDAAVALAWLEVAMWAVSGGEERPWMSHYATLPAKAGRRRAELRELTYGGGAE